MRGRRFAADSAPRDAPEGVQVLVAAARYLAAHVPTMRSQDQTYQIARRLYLRNPDNRQKACVVLRLPSKMHV